MVTIPSQFTDCVKNIINWHLNTYIPEQVFNVHLERVLEQLYKRNLVNGTVQIKESELYYISECVSDATSNVDECGVERSLVWKVFDWIKAERKRVNQ